MKRGYAWLETGNHDSLLEAGQCIDTLEKRRGLKVARPIEIDLRNGWIDEEHHKRLAAGVAKSGYG